MRAQAGCAPGWSPRCPVAIARDARMRTQRERPHLHDVEQRRVLLGGARLAQHADDAERLARALAEEMERTGNRPRLFVQVNTGEEPQKAGVVPAEADAFIAECRSLGLPLDGLMCIPPVDEEPAPHFALLKKIAERNGLPGLSMGMSADFVAAIALGATVVRINLSEQTDLMEGGGSAEDYGGSSPAPSPRQQGPGAADAHRLRRVNAGPKQALFNRLALG